MSLKKTDENVKHSWGEGGRFGWYSGPYVIVIEAHSVNPDEFLEKYLEKYPSSL